MVTLRSGNIAYILVLAAAAYSCGGEQIKNDAQGTSGRELVPSEPAPSSGGQQVASGAGGAAALPSTVGATGDSTVFVADDSITASDTQGIAGAANCIEVGVEVEKIIPTVMLLIDRSRSMDQNFGNSDRWNTLRDVLLDTTTGILSQREGEIRFGMSLYTSEHGNEGFDRDGLVGGAGGNAGNPAVCPIMVDVPIALNNFQAISTTYSTTEMLEIGDTPTAESLELVAAELLAFPEPGPKAIILATDGDPDTCVDADDHSAASQALSEAAVDAAFANGIRTYVISVGDQVTQRHLQALANAGVGAMGMDAPYYQALNPEGLVNAFDEIIFGVTPCEFQINGTVAASDARRGTVIADGIEVPYGDANGWDMPNLSTVRLLGTACDTFKQSAGRVDISFPCGTITLQ